MSPYDTLTPNVRVMKFLHPLVLVLVLILTACQKSDLDSNPRGVSASVPEPQEIDEGTIEDSVYTNKYFAFSGVLPAEWSIQERAMQKRLADLGSKIVAGDDPNLKSAMKASEAKSLMLFSVFKHPVGTPVSFNPNINCVAESVSDYPGIKTGKDYLFHARNLLGASQVQIKFSEETTSTNFGGVEFHTMHGSVNIGTIKIQQDYHATIRKGYALNFILTYGNDEEAAVLNKLMQSLEFN